MANKKQIETTMKLQEDNTVSLDDILPCEEAVPTELTVEQWKHISECKDNALKVAEDTQEKLRTQLNQQVEMYNHDMNYMTTVNSNTIKYSRAKEDATLKILEGVMSLMQLDRQQIVPAEKEEADTNGY